MVPRSILPGRYDSEIALQTNLLPFVLTLPMHVFVAHHGVHPKEGGLITLKYDPSTKEAKADIHLVTDAEKGTVRWWARFAEDLKPSDATQLLDRVRLRVASGNGEQSILRKRRVRLGDGGWAFPFESCRVVRQTEGGTL